MLHIKPEHRRDSECRMVAVQWQNHGSLQDAIELTPAVISDGRGGMALNCSASGVSYSTVSIVTLQKSCLIIPGISQAIRRQHQKFVAKFQDR